MVHIFDPDGLAIVSSNCIGHVHPVDGAQSVSGQIVYMGDGLTLAPYHLRMSRSYPFEWDLWICVYTCNVRMCVLTVADNLKAKISFNPQVNPTN